MAYDFNSADQQKDYGELIPGKTFAKVKMRIRMPKDADVGDMPEFTRSKSSQAQYLDCEFEVISEPLGGRFVWQNIMIAGVQDKALNISKAMLRAILESARGINTTDMSSLAVQARQVQSFSEFQGMAFVARIDIEAGKDGYKDKNRIGLVATPDKPEYAQVFAGQTIVGKEAPPPQTASRPASRPAATQQQNSWPVPGTAQAPPPPQQQNTGSPVPDWAR